MKRSRYWLWEVEAGVWGRAAFRMSTVFDVGLFHCWYSSMGELQIDGLQDFKVWDNEIKPVEPLHDIHHYLIIIQ